jgi:hypothetical protein
MLFRRSRGRGGTRPYRFRALPAGFGIDHQAGRLSLPEVHVDAAE